MLLDYETYSQLGGTVAEQDFAKAERFAELLLNHWTLYRLKSDAVIADLKEKGLWEDVETALAELVDRAEGIRAARKARAEGSEVTSFSNGVNSFSFGGSTATSSTLTAAESEAYAEVCRLLPVELVSACVYYNDAR